MMVALLLYAYCLGERSSRRIERLCEQDVAFRVLTANQRPDHATIARFRQTHKTALARLFAQVLRLCGEMGLVKVGVVALDGTKVEANTALAANRTAETIAKDVTTMLAEAQAVDDAEDRRYGPDQRGDELPEALRHRTSRLARLRECQARLKREATEAAAQQQAKSEGRQAEEAATGQKKRGRKPKAPQTAVDATAKANVTDPESRIMKTQRGYMHGHNAQAVVTADQIIVANDVTQEANDINQLHAMLAEAQEQRHTIEYPQPIGTVLADAGSGSEANLTEADPAGPTLLIATNKDWKQRQALREQPCPRGRIPRRLSQRERMEWTWLTKRGRALYKKRGQTVEPVFGQIKDGRGCDRFMRRGKQACENKWKLLCSTHNLLKLWRSSKAACAGRCRGRRMFGFGDKRKAGTLRSHIPSPLTVPPIRSPDLNKPRHVLVT
jgi:hypothetical protein